MPTKMDTTQNIKAYMTTQDKNTGKPKPLEHKGGANKQHNTNTNMVKEASPNESKQKHKANKNTKENKSISDSLLTSTPTPTPTPVKRDSSVRSPLDGNPKKKQCDTATLSNIPENTKQATNTGQLQTEVQAEGIINSIARSSEEHEEEYEKIHPTQSTEPDQNSLMQTILHEIKSIKETI